MNKQRQSVFEVRLLDGWEWGTRHGTHEVTDGRLQAKTDTDYLTFTCPGCETEMKGEFTAGLEGFSWVEEGQVIALSLRVACPRCGFRDFAKLMLDVAGKYVPSVRGNAVYWPRGDVLEPTCQGVQNDCSE